MADILSTLVDIPMLARFKELMDGLLAKKVDKVAGKGLSTNDLTDALLTKLNNAGTSNFSGAYADLSGKPGIATQSAAGLQSAEDKKKLDGIATGANKTVVDATLSGTSTNAIQNKAVYAALDGKVGKVNGKDLSSNDYTDAEKEKLAAMAEDAQANVLESVKVNGTALNIADKAVNITVPTSNNQLANGAGYQTATQVNAAITGKGYQTAAQVNAAITGKGYTTMAAVNTKLADYAKKSDISQAVRYKGTVAAYGNLPTTGNTIGDLWNVETAYPAKGIIAGDNVIWSGTDWDRQAGTIDTSKFYDSTSYPIGTNADIDKLFE